MRRIRLTDLPTWDPSAQLRGHHLEFQLRDPAAPGDENKAVCACLNLPDDLTDREKLLLDQFIAAFDWVTETDGSGSLAVGGGQVGDEPGDRRLGRDVLLVQIDGHDDLEQIQRSDEAGTFASDEEALSWVVARAAAGDDECLQALRRHCDCALRVATYKRRNR